jgi:hypothetical protein
MSNESGINDINETSLIISEISDSKNKFVQVGENTYRNNPTMRLISDVMCDSSFRELFDKTFSSWSETQAILMIMKLYQRLEFVHKKQDGNPPDKMAILGAVQQVMNDTEMRHNVMKAMQQFMDDKPKISESKKNDKNNNILE